MIPGSVQAEGRVGDSPVRPDGTLKVKGEFSYSSDLWLDDTLFGVTLRSPHPRARITGIDIAGALAVPEKPGLGLAFDEKACARYAA